ncbi:Fe-S protein assembly co-chaperone HscB [Enhygromyxa salina]|uniref:Fe-S protein assembly co-chaperone HscB n=1 Tax=Enhygromyxa salina TaxID=215803 RepID=UPI0015E60F46|nr:Fe-S protein assembly co-chaperone HscB [Enhygromyxa salina]
MAAESQSASELDPGLEGALDHFARLGLERGWRIDRDALEDNYLARSRSDHPDRHAGADARTRRVALERSAANNEAYRVLRDPVRRAEYLVKLGGIDLDSSDPQTGAPHPEQSFLIEMIERRDRLEELTTGGEDALAELRDEVDEELDAVFATAVDALDGGDTQAAAAALVQRRYLQRFLDEIDAAIDSPNQP